MRKFLALLLILLLCSPLFATWEGGPWGTNKVDISGVARDAKIVIYQKGGLIYSWDCEENKVIASGTELSVVLNDAFDELPSGRVTKQRVVVVGTYTDVDQIEIPSYTILDLSQANLTSVSSIPSTKPTGWPSNSFKFSLIINEGYPDDTCEYIEVIGGFVEALANPSTNDGKGSCAIAFRHANHLLIRDVHVRGGDKETGSHSGFGILVVYSENFLIENCCGDSTEYDIFQIDASKNGSVVNCTVLTMDTTSAGVSIDGSGIQLSSCSNVKVLNNDVFANSQSGIRNCHVVNTKNDRLSMNKIIGNSIYCQSPDSGIWGIDFCDSVNNCISYDNHVFDCYMGILIRGSGDTPPKKPSGNVFSDNFIYNSKYGVYFRNLSNGDTHKGGNENYFTNNTFAKCSHSGGALVTLCEGNGNVFRDNLVRDYDNVSGDMVIDSGYQNHFSDNTEYTLVTIGAANIEDTYNTATSTSHNGSSEEYFYSGCNSDAGNRRTFLDPDTNYIPSGFTVDQAICSVYCYASQSATVEAIGVDSNIVCSQATWLIFSTGNNWNTGGGDLSTPTDTITAIVGWMAFDVTNIINGMRGGTLHAIALREEGDCGSGAVRASFYATEYAADTSLRPRIWLACSRTLGE